MLYRVIDADKLSSLVRGFMNDYEVIAPVKRDQGYVFAVIHDPDEVEFDYTTTITSPKKFFLPSEEVLMRFDAEENEVTDFAIDLKPRVLFGVHPCDINALNRLDLVYKDVSRSLLHEAAREHAHRRTGLHARACVLLQPVRHR